MNSSDSSPAMNQDIFNLGLSVETVSVYLLCCSLADAGVVISIERLREIWNGGQDALMTALENLENRNIILRKISEMEENNTYKLTDAKNWKVK
jgi:hypothetical protein